MNAMRRLRTLGLWLMLTALPASASAVTIDQIVALKKAGVTDAVVLALIERDRTVFSLQPEQIVALQRDGLSEAIIIAMLKSGEAGDEAARAESAYSSAIVAAAIAPAPDVLIVGHGPERPNTYHEDGFFTNNLSWGGFNAFSAYPSFVPYGVPSVPYFGRQRFTQRSGSAQPRAMCYAQVNGAASRSTGFNFVTECPRVLQPRRTR